MSPEEKSASEKVIRTFNENHSTPFTEVVTRIQGSDLSKKLSKTEKQKIKRNNQRAVVQHVEGNQQKGNRDAYALLVSGSSFNSHNQAEKKIAMFPP